MTSLCSTFNKFFFCRINSPDLPQTRSMLKCIHIAILVYVRFGLWRQLMIRDKNVHAKIWRGSGKRQMTNNDLENIICINAQDSEKSDCNPNKMQRWSGYYLKDAMTQFVWAQLADLSGQNCFGDSFNLLVCCLFSVKSGRALYWLVAWGCWTGWTANPPMITWPHPHNRF